MRYITLEAVMPLLGLNPAPRPSRSGQAHLSRLLRCSLPPPRASPPGPPACSVSTRYVHSHFSLSHHAAPLPFCTEGILNPPPSGHSTKPTPSTKPFPNFRPDMPRGPTLSLHGWSLPPPHASFCCCLFSYPPLFTYSPAHPLKGTPESLRGDFIFSISYYIYNINIYLVYIINNLNSFVKRGGHEQIKLKFWL